MNAANAGVSIIQTRCCIAGGGPAGMMLGFLLARSGVDVVILEKHADFLRDFRGDTIHPSTLELMYELGLLDEFLQRPHQQLTEIGGVVEGIPVTIADFSHLPTHSKFIALMPQWDFLNFLAEKGAQYPAFHLHMNAEVSGLLEQDGRVTGVRGKSLEGAFEVHAELTIGADGRHSTVRTAAAFDVIDLGAPIDVLWLRITRHPDDPDQTLGRFQAGKILVTLNRGDYWQCAYVIRKGTFEAVRERGLAAFRQEIASIAPFLTSRVDEISDWTDVKLLTVAVDRLRNWSRPGLMCIGDSAHAMSPVGGVGINLAIQDAVAAANILFSALLDSRPIDPLLCRVQRRREFAVRITQAFQLMAHRQIFGGALGRTTPVRRLPRMFQLLKQFPILRRLPARMVGVGFRPEHIRTPDSNRT